MSTAIDEFIVRAREVSFADACDRLNVPAPAKGKSEYQGPCPIEGGKDRFSVNRGKGVWNCRGCGTGGHDGLGLAAHMQFLDLRIRSHFLIACERVLCESAPKDGERETDDERAARESRIAAAKLKADARRADRDRTAERKRREERDKARGIWLRAVDCGASGDQAVRGATVISIYLQARTGFVPTGGVFDNLRFVPSCTYWHGEDDRGRPVSFHSGPAMIAPFVNLEGAIIGCHQTWIDLGNTAKRRPVLLDDKGEALPTKKMRGTKKGGLIPLCGEMAALRWVGGEGIETVAAIAGAEGWRADTFYFAAGDIGNLCGPADPESDFIHPTLVKIDVRGARRKVKVRGPVPKADQGEDEAVQVPPHVTELVLLADGDSEPIATASDMARAYERFSTQARQVAVWWPPEKTDFADAIASAVQCKGMISDGQ